MSDGYTKLFGSIIHSTVWREPNHVRLVWITLLAMANRDGEVMASVPGLADAARVSIQECESALGRLKAPDPYSRTKEFEGRRIVDIPGGWEVLTYGIHRNRMSQEERRAKAAERQRKHRERKKKIDAVADVAVSVTSVTERDSNEKSHSPSASASASGVDSEMRGGAGGESRETPMPLSWEPSSAAIDAFKAQHKVSDKALQIATEEFKGYWTIGEGMGRKKRNWQFAWQQRMLALVRGGDLEVMPTKARNGVRGALTERDEANLAERRREADRGRDMREERDRLLGPAEEA